MNHATFTHRAYERLHSTSSHSQICLSIVLLIVEVQTENGKLLLDDSPLLTENYEYPVSRSVIRAYADELSLTYHFQSFGSAVICHFSVKEFLIKFNVLHHVEKSVSRITKNVYLEQCRRDRVLPYLSMPFFNSKFKQNCPVSYIFYR